MSNFKTIRTVGVRNFVNAPKNGMYSGNVRARAVSTINKVDPLLFCAWSPNYSTTGCHCACLLRPWQKTNHIPVVLCRMALGIPATFLLNYCPWTFQRTLHFHKVKTKICPQALHNSLLTPTNMYGSDLLVLRERILNAVRNVNPDASFLSTWGYFPLSDSSVGIATRYAPDGQGIESRWGRDFPHPSRPTLGPIQRPVQWVLGLCRGGNGSSVVLTTRLIPVSA